MRKQNLEQKIDLIMTNHLPHLQAKVNDHDSKLKLILFVLATIFIAVVGQYFR